MNSETGDSPEVRPMRGKAYSVEVRGGQVQVGEHNTQINYLYYGRIPTGEIAPPPSASVSGEIISPYRGLGEFREQDAPFFFGREDAATEVLNRMSRVSDQEGLLVVSGASGAGKSSLLKAGVLPRLRGAGLASAPDAASWPCLFLVPGQTPLDELALGAAALTSKAAETVRRELKADPSGFILTARQAARARPPSTDADLGTTITQGPPGARLVLIVDQFEQIFTQCKNEDERQAFVTALSAAAQGSGGIPAALVILGVRADFEVRCASYPELRKAVQDRYLVTPLTERQLKLAITSPARLAGAQVDRELAETLLAHAARRPEGTGAGVLPLLSYALDEAWRSRTSKDHLSLADYDRKGGIEGAVAASAERAYSSLTADQQAAAKRVFVRLVAAGPDGVETADRVTQAELVRGKDSAEVDDVKKVLEAFAAERLLTLAADSVEISHEALLTAWPLLHDEWLAETHADRIVRTRLRGTTTEWDRRSRDSSYLYRGTLLQAATETMRRTTADPTRYPPLSTPEREFLRASGEAQRRSTRRRQAVIGALATLTLIAGVLAVWANQQRAVASHQRNQAIENQIVAEAGQLGASNPSLSADLLSAAYRIAPSEDLASRLINTENWPMSASSVGDGAVESAEFSSDGRTLATGDRMGQVILWRIDNTGPPRRIGVPLKVRNTSTVLSVAFSSTGKILATGDGDGTVTIWDVSDPSQPRQLSKSRISAPGNDAVFSVRFSSNGKIAALGIADGSVELWNVSNPAQPKQIGRPLVAINTQSMSRFCGSNCATIVYSVAFSPDGRTLVAGDAGGEITLWNVGNPAQPITLHPPGQYNTTIGAYSVAFSPDGKSLALGESNGSVALWNVSNPAQPQLLGQPLSVSDNNGVLSVAFSPDGKTIASGDGGGKVTLWNLSNPAQPQQLGQPLTSDSGISSVRSVAFSPNSQTIAAGSNSGVVTLWNMPQSTLHASIKGAGNETQGVTALSPDGKILAVGDNRGEVLLWNISNPAQPRQLGQPLTSNGYGVNSVAFSSSENTLAAGNNGGTVTLWDVSNPAQPRQLSRPITNKGHAAYCVAFSPNGRTLAVGNDGGTVSLWDVSNPAQPRQIVPPGKYSSIYYITSVAFSPNGRFLAISNDSGLVNMYDVGNPERPRKIGSLSINSDAVFSVAFSPNGRTIATGDNSSMVSLWDVSNPAKPKRLGRPFTSGNSVDSLAFSPNGQTIAAGNDSAMIALWNVVDPSKPQQLGQPLTSSSNGDVSSVAFSPDGNTLVSGGTGSTTAQVWSLNPNYAISRTCRLAGGALTPAQWKRYIPQLDYKSPCRGDG